MYRYRKWLEGPHIYRHRSPLCILNPSHASLTYLPVGYLPNQLPVPTCQLVLLTLSYALVTYLPNQSSSYTSPTCLLCFTNLPSISSCKPRPPRSTYHCYQQFYPSLLIVSYYRFKASESMLRSVEIGSGTASNVFLDTK